MRKVENLETLRMEIQKNIEDVFPLIYFSGCGITYTNKIEDFEYTVKYDNCIDIEWCDSNGNRNAVLIIGEEDIRIRKGEKTHHVLDYNCCKTKTQMMMEIAIYLNKLFN